LLWNGRKDANGGSCLVTWEKVTRPIDLGETRNSKSGSHGLGATNAFVLHRENETISPMGWFMLVYMWNFFIFIFHDFTKINDALKICQKYTIAATPHGGRVPNIVWYGVRDLSAIRYDV
jgi:hypothetical protein